MVAQQHIPYMEIYIYSDTASSMQSGGLQQVAGQSSGISLPISQEDKARIMSDEASMNNGRPTQHASEVQSAADNYSHLYPTPPIYQGGKG